MPPTRTITLALFSAIIGFRAFSSEPATNSVPDNFFSSVEWTNLVTINNAIADLGTQLNWNADEDVVSEFDRQVCKSIGIRPWSPAIVSYKVLSLVFHLPKTNEWFKSSQDLAGFPKLLCQKGKIVRTNTQEQVPSNDIFLFDPNVKELTVEIELLLSVAPVEKPQEIKYLRRSFRFVHRSRWESD